MEDQATIVKNLFLDGFPLGDIAYGTNISYENVISILRAEKLTSFEFAKLQNSLEQKVKGDIKFDKIVNSLLQTIELFAQQMQLSYVLKITQILSFLLNKNKLDLSQEQLKLISILVEDYAQIKEELVWSLNSVQLKALRQQAKQNMLVNLYLNLRKPGIADMNLIQQLENQFNQVSQSQIQFTEENFYKLYKISKLAISKLKFVNEQPANQEAKHFRTISENPRSFSLYTQNQYSIFSSQPTEENLIQKQPGLVRAIGRNSSQILQFDTKNNIFQTFNVQGLKTGSGSSSVMLPNGNLMVCGHGFYALINQQNKLRRISPPLDNQNRSYVALVYFNKAIHMFGGDDNGPIQDSEIYFAGKWRKIADLPMAMSHLTAITVNQTIFIGGFKHSPMLYKYFNNSYQEICFNFPQFDLGSCSLLIFKDTVYRFYLSWGETYTKEGFCNGRIDLPRHCLWSNSKPVVIKGKIYFTPQAYSTYKVRMERFDPKTATLECLGTQSD